MKHTDPIDAASQREMESRRDAEKAIRSLVPEVKDELTDEDLECDMCGEEIDHRRAKNGYTTCITCARLSEERSKQYNRKIVRHYEGEE